MNSNAMFGTMCNPEATGSVYGHHPHHQSQHYSSSPDLGSPAYCGSGGGNTTSEASTNNGGGHYGSSALHAQAAAAAAVAAASVASSEANTTVNNNQRSNSVEAGSGSGGQHSPTGIISDNGLQYANLDGSGGPGGPGSGPGSGSYYHHPAMAASAGYHAYSDIHGDGGLAATIAASGGQTGSFSAYLDNPSAAAAAYAQSQGYPSIYGQHHPHSLKSISRGSPHEFSPSSYPADFAAAAAVSKPTPAVPTYKWMQVKRNVPKPGRSNFYKIFTGKASEARFIFFS